MVYIVLGKGFEEIEALAPFDVLQRGGVEVKLASVEGELVEGGHGITVKTHINVEDIDISDVEMLVFPGGMGGVESISKSEKAMALMTETYKSGKIAAAICAAPTLLAKLGILDGKDAVCYPGMEDEMAGANIKPENSVKDGNVITGKAAGASFDFALELLKTLKGEEIAENVRKAIYYK